MKKNSFIRLLIFLFFMLCGLENRTLNVNAYTIYDSPYVTFSPDGLAWTADAGRQDVVWYREDGSDDVITGISSSLRQPGRGEHYYSVRRIGAVPVSRWRVELAKVNCCHHDYPADGEYHGVRFAKQICLKPHFSAWRPVCADCGETIVRSYFYMSREAAASIAYFHVGPNVSYYYLCPFNDNLEQGTGLQWHRCKSISYNRYRVEYMPNTGGGAYNGSMQSSFHMYDNSEEYDGQKVTPQTRLNPIGYKRTGWVFLGWNTEADGSGDFYEDEAEILNLCDEEYQPGEDTGTIKLYAMWKKVTGKLSIMLIGVSYKSIQGMYTVSVPYGERYVIDRTKFWGNRGYYIAFALNGGTGTSTIHTTQRFAGLRPYEGQVMKGELRDNIYYFAGEDGDWDRIEPVFEQPEVVLPAPTKENYSFGGWYYDPQLRQFAGYGGDKLTPSQNMYLYARWVELKLESEVDMEVHGGTGAVDLRWSQPDSKDKVYQVYQSMDNRTWQQVFSEDDIRINTPEEIQYDGEDSGTVYEVPEDGYYHLEAHGASGEDYGYSKGGCGGKTEGVFYLEEGEMLTFYTMVRKEQGEDDYDPVYGRGGEFAAIESDRQGLLILAGGGGGAGPGVGGGMGGEVICFEPVSVGLRYGENGKQGVSSGGGGYHGGSAGSVLVHEHTEGVCNHVHQGDPGKQGGCYTIPVKCGETLQHKLDRVKHWYWAGSDTIYCPACGADATKGETCSGHDTYYYAHICPEHGEQSNNTSEAKPKICSKVVSYDPGCGIATEYTCGYEAGEVLSAEPSGGGSSYINVLLAESYSYEAGENTDGTRIGIYFEPERYLEKTELENLRATDLQAPDAVDDKTVTQSPAGAETVCVQWEEPSDGGSAYYHVVQSFDRTTGYLISTSNTTRDILVSGVDGYYYMVNDEEEAQYEKLLFHYTQDRQVLIRLTDREQYLHLAAADKADNVSEVIHIRICNKKNEDGEIKWPIYTRPLQMEESDTVYQRDPSEPYYIRCDGSASFGLRYSAYMAGQPADSYQLNQCIFESVENDTSLGRNIVCVPDTEISQERISFPMRSLRYLFEDDPILHIASYAEAVKQNGIREITLKQKFVPDSACDGRKFRIIPVAGACSEAVSVYSEYPLDELNGLDIIGDGTAPVIGGLDEFGESFLLDRRDGAVELRITARDTLSGVKDFYVEINNLDNGCYSKEFPDETGVIRVLVTEDLPIFSGDFAVIVYAEDHVGNAVTEEYRTTEFDLQADIVRILEPHEPQFKKGESGVLKITSWGYADRVEVEFPDEFNSGGNMGSVYTYERNPSYRQDEELEFMIPLYVPDDVGYCVTVRAYKGDRMLEVHPAFAVMGVSGSMLDELRTRLR